MTMDSEEAAGCDADDSAKAVYAIVSLFLNRISDCDCCRCHYSQTKGHWVEML